MKHGKAISLLLLLTGLIGLLTLEFGDRLPNNPLQFSSTTVTTTTVVGNTILGSAYGVLFVLFVALIVIPLYGRLIRP